MTTEANPFKHMEKQQETNKTTTTTTKKQQQKNRLEFERDPVEAYFFRLYFHSRLSCE